MQRIRTLSLTVAILLLLAACDSSPSPTPSAQPTAQPTSAVFPQVATPPPAAATATSVPVIKPGNLFPAGITNEALSVVSTSPADKSTDTPLAKESARIIVQFNHPVVPLVSVDPHKSLPQPLTITPAVADNHLHLLDRQRLQTWQRKFYAQIESVTDLLLPIKS